MLMLKWCVIHQPKNMHINIGIIIWFNKAVLKQFPEISIPMLTL